MKAKTKRKPKLSATARARQRRTHGRYLGLMRHAPRPVKAIARKVCAQDGIPAAIAYLQRKAS